MLFLQQILLSCYTIKSFFTFIFHIILHITLCNNLLCYLCRLLIFHISFINLSFIFHNPSFSITKEGDRLKKEVGANASFIHHLLVMRRGFIRICVKFYP